MPYVLDFRRNSAPDEINDRSVIQQRKCVLISSGNACTCRN